jgi:S1-C subfamily serine protease
MGHSDWKPIRPGYQFAIPSNVVRRVAPALIQNKVYDWPYLGIMGESVDLAITRGNGLQDQSVAYIHQVAPGGPVDKAGLKGSRGTAAVDGVMVPKGGDIVVEADGKIVRSFIASWLMWLIKMLGTRSTWLS